MTETDKQSAREVSRGGGGGGGGEEGTLTSRTGSDTRDHKNFVPYERRDKGDGGREREREIKVQYVYEFVFLMHLLLAQLGKNTGLPIPPNYAREQKSHLKWSFVSWQRLEESVALPLVFT